MPADAVIAADGAYSPIKRALKLDSRVQRLLGDRDPGRDAGQPPGLQHAGDLPEAAFQGDQLPGYGWVFPFGDGQVNIGLGYVNSYRKWQQINATAFLGEFMATLPARVGAAARSTS